MLHQQAQAHVQNVEQQARAAIANVEGKAKGVEASALFAAQGLQAQVGSLRSEITDRDREIASLRAELGQLRSQGPPPGLGPIGVDQRRPVAIAPPAVPRFPLSSPKEGVSQQGSPSFLGRVRNVLFQNAIQ